MEKVTESEQSLLTYKEIFGLILSTVRLSHKRALWLISSNGSKSGQILLNETIWFKTNILKAQIFIFVLF